MKSAVPAPNNPKKTHSPPHVSTEMRAQLRRRIRPMPAATPKIDKQVRKASITSAIFFARGGSSEKTFAVVPSNSPRRPKVVARAVAKPAKMATTAAAMTEAEGVGDVAIKTVYTISRNRNDREAEGNRKEKIELDVRFLFA